MFRWSPTRVPKAAEQTQLPKLGALMEYPLDAAPCYIDVPLLIPHASANNASATGTWGFHSVTPSVVNDFMVSLCMPQSSSGLEYALHGLVSGPIVLRVGTRPSSVTINLWASATIGFTTDGKICVKHKAQEDFSETPCRTDCGSAALHRSAFCGPGDVRTIPV